MKRLLTKLFLAAGIAMTLYVPGNASAHSHGRYCSTEYFGHGRYCKTCYSRHGTTKFCGRYSHERDFYRHGYYRDHHRSHHGEHWM